MGGICFSVAPILRCESLTRLQSGVLIVPTALEIVFSLGLIALRRGSNRKQLLLAADGLFFFFLAFLDLLSHTIPSIGRSLNTFKPLDIFIGSASLVPILLYTLFLLLLTTDEIVSIFGTRLQSVSKYALALLIPAIIAANELGSFFSISYESLGPGESVVGFKNKSLKMVFDNLSLALLTVFQVLALFFAGSRLYKALHQQRRPHSVSDSTKIKAMQIRGLGWIVAGLSLGTIEVLVGFASGGFSVAMARRALRFLSRACLLFGVLQGVDSVENFRIFSPESARDARRSNLRALISNPRASTFQKIGGHHFEFDPENIPTSERSPTRLTIPGLAAYPTPIPQPSPNYDRESSIYSSVTTPTTARHTRLIALHLSNEISLSDTPRSSVRSIVNRPSRAQSMTVTPMSAAFTTAATESFTPTSMRSPLPPPPSFPLQRNLSTSRSRLQRVTVHYDSDMNRAPFLELRRISQLDLENMLTNLDHFHEPAGLRRKNSWGMDTPAMAKDDTETVRSPTRSGTTKLQFRRTLAGIESGRHKVVSASTVGSLDIVHALAGQFPKTPTPPLPSQILAALTKPVEEPVEQEEELVEEQLDKEEHSEVQEELKQHELQEQPAEQEQAEEQALTLARPEPVLSRPSSIRRASVASIALKRETSVKRKSVPTLETLSKDMTATSSSVPLSRASIASTSSINAWSAKGRPGSVYSVSSVTSISSEERIRKAMTLPAKAKAQEPSENDAVPPINVALANLESEETTMMSPEAEVSSAATMSPAEKSQADQTRSAGRRRSGSLSTIILAAEGSTEKVKGRSRASTISSGSYSPAASNDAEERKRKGRTLPPKQRSSTLPKSIFFKAQAFRRDSSESSSTDSELVDEPSSTFRIDLNVADSDTDSVASSSTAQERSRKARTLPAKARAEQLKVDVSSKRQTMAPLSIETAKSPLLPSPVPSTTSQTRSPQERAKKAMTLPPQARSPLDESAEAGVPALPERAGRPPLMRIKSVGSVPRRRTPTPTQTVFGRGSIVVEWITPPPRVVEDAKPAGGRKLRKRSKSRPRTDAEVVTAVQVGTDASI